MPNIENIDVPVYQPLSPYNHLVDNLPIYGLIDRITSVNNQVDLNNLVLSSAIGTQGTLANRLAQSINADGSLKTTAIDNALHNIAEHLDGNGYVRMTLDERAKLSFIAAHATSLTINIDTISGTVPFANTILEIEPSDSITWRFDNGKIAADTNFPASVRHAHYYGIVPYTTNRLNYKTSSVATAYKQGSMRVYINGVRLNQNVSVYVPIGVPSSTTWTAFSFTEDSATNGIVTTGGFTMSATVPSSANVVIDFDILYT
jgi:hypothetical protein